MRHRNLLTGAWPRMAIDSLFARGTLSDWREFARALRDSPELAKHTLVMCEHHADQAAAALARVLVEHFHSELVQTIRGSSPNRDARHG